MPYLYTTTEEMSRTGVPDRAADLRGLPRCDAGQASDGPDAASEFLFGPEILVAPAPYPDELDDYFVQLAASHLVRLLDWREAAATAEDEQPATWNSPPRRKRWRG